LVDFEVELSIGSHVFSKVILHDGPTIIERSNRKATMFASTSMQRAASVNLLCRSSRSIDASRSPSSFQRRVFYKAQQKQSFSAAAPQQSFMTKHPFLFQLGIATGKTAAADLIVQTVAEGKTLSQVDWKRNGIFVVFGFVYLGGFQWWLMVTKYRQWFPTMDRFAKLSFAEKVKDTAGILDAGKMVLFDLMVHLPFLYFPAYYAVKEFVGGTSWNPLEWIQDGVGKYKNNLKEDLTAMVKLWGPSDCVQFVLPIHIRMPFRHLVSFFWTAYISFTRGKYEAVKKPMKYE
jgi:hypothetical protein